VRPAFDYGDAVRVLRTVRNDGTYPGLPTGALLLRRGSVGFVRDVGTFLQDQIIYSVHFLDQDRMVGCREEELQPAADPWVPSRFEFRDRVRARIPLGIAGRVLVERGTEGEVLKVIRDAPGGVAYHVWFDGRNPLQVPESALDGLGLDDAG
jgi:nitrogen fixation protein NifZ